VQGRHLAQRLGATFLPSILLIAGCHADPPSGTVADASAAPAIEASAAPTIEASAAPPVSVTVPSVGISSKLVRLGLHDDRTMEVPVDSIEVGRADGSVAVFRVDALEQYPKNRFPTAKVYGNLHHAGLRLITCGGDFDRERGHYRDNIVVYASLTAPRGGAGGSPPAAWIIRSWGVWFGSTIPRPVRAG
jgi:hypothetical protein